MLDAFWIDKYEVTNEQFTRFAQATGYDTDAERLGESWVFNGSKWEVVKGADWEHPTGPGTDITDKMGHPVVQVSWNDANAYCKWVGGRLPTEAEWEATLPFCEAVRQRDDLQDAARSMVYFIAGAVYVEAQDYERAIADWSEAIRLDPDAEMAAAAYAGRGLAYAERGETERAIADWSEAIRLDPDAETAARAYYNRGNAYAKRGETERAIADYDKAIRLDPEYATVYYNMACAYALQGEVEATLAPLRRALELDPVENLAQIPSDEDFDGVRDDERFQALLTEFLA